MGYVKRNSRIPGMLSIFINIRAITIYPWIFIKDNGDDKLINHERIHIKQQKELFLIGFYFLYFVFWIIGLLKYQNAQEAYRNIPFEKEAYANEEDWVYVLNRQWNGWIYYI